MSDIEPANQAPQEPAVMIGDITVTPAGIVTPSGTTPVAGATWNVADMTTTTETIPAYAIVLAILFFVFCLLGLLFLLIKEKRTTGHVQVTVQAPGFLHTTQIPVSSPLQIQQIHAQVNWARSLGAAQS